MSMSNRPDRQLIVKCTFDKAHKRINFNSARNCSYDLLKDKVERCFSLSPSTYAISWKDDDGEITNIMTDGDLSEAIQYFCTGDDAPVSSAASILSGRSFGSRKVTLRVTISVEYDGPSLSDTSSLVSLDEYRSRNGSQRSFSFGAPSIELDDDSITVSSKDQGASVASHSRSSRAGGSRLNQTRPSPTILHHSRTPDALRANGRIPHQQASQGSSYLYPDKPQESEANRSVNVHDHDLSAAMERYPADPSAVFERLRLQEDFGDDSSSDWDPISGHDRGAAWLRDQNERAIRSMLGVLPEPSISDSASLSFDDLSRDLALERGTHGKFYYTYTGSSASQTQGSNDEEGLNGMSDSDLVVIGETRMEKPRPTSMHLNWLAAQQIETLENRRPHPSASVPSFTSHNSDPLPNRDHRSEDVYESIDRELLLFLDPTSPPSEILTDCSNCGVLLDSIRYVCYTCGEKQPLGTCHHDRDKDRYGSNNFQYPPQLLPFSGGSSSSQTYVGSSESFFNPHRPKVHQTLFNQSSFLTSSIFGSKPQLRIPVGDYRSGYELCSNCLESAGIRHAVEAGLGTPGTSMHDSQWRRTAPKKGQTRHAYQEKVWGQFGWEDVVQDESTISQCSTCSAVTTRQRYKCASCEKLHLCRACYTVVHDLHPTHAFLVVPDKPARSQSEPEYIPTVPPDPNDELSLEHPGVSCAHCLRPIVGARFHCAICDSVDICSNCESAGLPGNLDSSDGGHTSSHILIKIPYPLENNELQNASQRAFHLWTGRDEAVAYGVSKSKAKSEISSYARTVVGAGSMPHPSHPSTDHGIYCNSCSHPITGVRYQCAHCVSSPTSYNLCANCETRSYVVHDPMHIFFKFPRPVQRPLESQGPLLPPLYKVPAGPPGVLRAEDPRAYLKSLVHTIAVCDRCMNRIEGEWFRCAYCPVDLCDRCEEVDTHDDSHVFMVFKSTIDLQVFRGFTNVEDPPPVIPHPVYL